MFPRLRRPAHLVLALLLLCSAARADEWVLIWLTGEKPQRRAFFASVDSARPAMSDLDYAQRLTRTRTPEEVKALDGLRNQVRRLDILEVCEDASGYDTNQLLLELDTATRQYRCPRGTAWHRDGKIEDYAEMEWRPLQANWEKRAFAFGSEEIPWRAAYEALRQQVITTGGDDPTRVDQSRLIEMEMLAVGPHSVPMDLSDLVWKTIWSDGARPPYGAPVNEVLMAQIMKNAQAGAAERRAELEKVDPLPNSPSWSDEEQLLAQMGRPWATRTEGRLTYHVYREEMVEDVLDNAPPPSTGLIKIGEIVHWRETTYVVDNGVIVDVYERVGQF